MAGTYKTVQGDTWDLIAYKVYGEEKYMRYLIEANWDYIDILVFDSSGVVLTIPDLPEEPDEDMPFWRIDTEDADDEEESDAEDDDDGGDSED